jgi:hypothetical protein
MARLYFVTVLGAAPFFLAWAFLDAFRIFRRFEKWRASQPMTWAESAPMRQVEVGY